MQQVTRVGAQSRERSVERAATCGGVNPQMNEPRTGGGWCGFARLAVVVPSTGDFDGGKFYDETR